jgi:DNA invertase Pin-like site-specific DNA recombinase
MAYSYVRFSTADQMRGNSLQRQTEAAADWCARHNVTLDTSLTLHDLGRSGYTGAHRKNPDRHALALFLKLSEDGPGRRVPRGSYLVVENLDRLSREHVRPALTLLLNLIEAGIRIVQLKPVEQVFDEDVEPMALMMAIMELSRGHSESAMKSERNGKAWQAKLGRARGKTLQPPRKKDGRLTDAVTSRLPAWVEDRDGRMQLIPARAEAIRTIFRLAAGGYGLTTIVKKLTADKVPPFGEREVVREADGTVVTTKVRGRQRAKYRAGDGSHYGAGVWVRAYVAKILKDRRVIGDYQPCGKGRKPVGEPIKGYYPQVVSEQEFHAVQDGLSKRRLCRGRTSEHVNLFASLLKHASGRADHGDSFFTGATSRGQRTLINTAGAEGRATFVSFPADVFERAVLSQLREIDPKDILEGTNGHDEVMALEGELGQVEDAIEAIVLDLDTHGESPRQYARLRQKEARKKELVELLADARRKAAQPLSAAWGGAKTLLAVLDRATNPKDARLRLRAALRRVVESMWMLVVTRGIDRLAHVQVRFEGGAFRTYLILYRPARGNARRTLPARFYVSSLRQPDAARLGIPFGMEDLRDGGEYGMDIDLVRSFLENYPADMIDKLLAEDGHDVV